MTDYNFPLIIVITVVAFFALAAILLIPIYRFLVKEERITRDENENPTQSWPGDAGGNGSR